MFGLFNAGFERAQNGYIRICGLLVRKVGVALIILAGFVVLAGGLGKTLSRSFLPDEDQGYFMVNVELPEAASLQRTMAVMKTIDAVLRSEPAIQYVSGIGGYSMLSQTSSPRNAFFFCSLKPYDERMTAALQAGPIIESVNRKLFGLPGAIAFAFPPPAIPGIGQASGVDFFIQDRAGHDVDYLWSNTAKFLAAAHKRPELGQMNLLFTPAVPQLFAAVDKDKAFKLGVPINDVYEELQTLLGGYYVNQFNRFGRVWKVFVEAEPRYRNKATDVGQFYVRNSNGGMVPLSTLVTMKRDTGPEYTTRFNEYRSIEIFAAPAPGYSTDDAMRAIKEVSDSVLPRDMGYAWNGISYQQSIAGGGAGVFALSIVLVFLILAALYQSWSLPFSVLLSVPVAVCGAFFGLWSRRFGQRHLRANRPDHADRIVGEKRDPDRRIRQGRTRKRRIRDRRGAERSAPAAPADPHDLVRLHLRSCAAVVRAGRGRHGPAPDRHRHYRGHGVFERDRDFSRAAALRHG